MQPITDKLLLYHPQKEYTYIRKLTMSYGYYLGLAVTNHNNQVTHIGLDNTFTITPYKKLTQKDKQILGHEKCQNLKNNDLISIFRINKALKLNKPFRLEKKCNNMRYTTPYETYQLKKIIQQTHKENNNIIINKNTHKYTNSIHDNIILKPENIEIDTQANNITPLYQETNTIKGQTKLI